MSIQFVEPGAVHSLREKYPDMLLVDVRDPGDHTAMRMADSVCCPLDELDGGNLLRQHGGDASRPLLLICQLGKRSFQAAQTLESHIENPIYVLSGGLNACLEAGLELIHGAHGEEL